MTVINVERHSIPHNKTVKYKIETKGIRNFVNGIDEEYCYLTICYTDESHITIECDSEDESKYIVDQINSYRRKIGIRYIAIVSIGIGSLFAFLSRKV